VKYIVVQHGSPHVSDVLPSYDHPSRLAVLGRTWEHIHAFDDSSRYALVLDPVPPISAFQRLLASTIYNPSVSVAAQWKRVSDNRTADIISLIEEGLKRDDDIIQQWFGAPEVIRLLKAASSWEELMIAVSCICGGHERDDRAKRYVDEVLRRRK
jgi:hypothetical protein